MRGSYTIRGESFLFWLGLVCSPCVRAHWNSTPWCLLASAHSLPASLGHDFWRTGVDLTSTDPAMKDPQKNFHVLRGYARYLHALSRLSYRRSPPVLCRKKWPWERPRNLPKATQLSSMSVSMHLSSLVQLSKCLPNWAQGLGVAMQAFSSQEIGRDETGVLIPNFKGKILNPHVHHWEGRF